MKFMGSTLSLVVLSRMSKIKFQSVRKGSGYIFRISFLFGLYFLDNLHKSVYHI